MDKAEVFPPARVQTSADTPQSSAPASIDGAGLVCKDDLVRTVGVVGHGYEFSRRGLAGGDAVLQGEFETVALRPGLVLQRTRVRDLHDMQTHLVLEPALKVCLLLDGETEVSYGALDLRLGPRRDAHGRLRNPGSVVALAEPETFRRRWRRGRTESKISVTVQPAWLDGGPWAESEAMDRLRSFRSRHLACQHWQPSPRALVLAHQILHPPALAAPLRHWYLEARTIEFAAEALGAVAAAPDRAQPPAVAPMAERLHRRMRELQRWLDEHAASVLTLDDIARQAAMSPTALQRAFRAFSGQPLFDYVRGRRLDAARQALERDGISVAQAAEMAGYAGAHNFATAFRRRFGIAPSRARLRL